MTNKQNDYCCLSVSTQDSQDVFETHSACLTRNASYSKEVGDVSAGMFSHGKECYVPVNFIDEEVLKLIAQWKVPAQQNNILKEDSAGSLVPYLPPKRFFRTFWRSMSRRYLHTVGV